ncbi:MAG: hypothetical protein SFU53_09155 [Terrimicrobiaceae bacterium]|nr:hypothetical protein [Terrimicrobiaceae bacterium]
MILSLGFTQFVLLSLGILALKVLLKAGGYAANVADTFPPFAVFLANQGIWLFSVPLAWVAFGMMCVTVNRGPLRPVVAQWSGVAVVLAIIACYFFAATTLF